MEARELVREIVGTVRLEPDTNDLIAKFERSAIPLLRTGTGRWIGSGGVLWTCSIFPLFAPKGVNRRAILTRKGV